MLQYKIWDRQEPINGVEANFILENRPELRIGDIILIHNEGRVIYIEMLDVLRGALGFNDDTPLEDVVSKYISSFDSSSTVVTLDEYKNQKKSDLEIDYNKALQGDFQSLGYTFSYDEEAQKNFTKVTALLALKPEKVDTAWNTKSHGIILLTKEQYLQVVEDAENHEWFNLGKLWNYKHKVEIAQSYDEVDAVVWE